MSLFVHGTRKYSVDMRTQKGKDLMVAE